jgi:uncharacterized lipoprotein YbaY
VTSGSLGNSRDRERVVRGAIAFEAGAPALRGATVYIRLEDVTEADAPSRLVAQEVLRGISKPSRGGQIPFEMRTGGIDERASYNVSVLVDLDGDGRPSRGDFSSVQSYPVLTHSHPSEVSVVVRRVS